MTTTPTDETIHLVFLPVDGPARPQCGGSGRSVMRIDEVTCQACLQDAPSLHDTHAIPANDKPKPTTAAEINPGDLFADSDDDEWVAVTTGHETCLVNPAQLYTTKHVVEKWGPLVKYLSDDEPISTVEPAKTHDLSVRKLHGGTVITAESEADNYGVYLPPGAAQDLGRVLDLLTPAQVQLLIGDLTGGEK